MEEFKKYLLEFNDITYKQWKENVNKVISEDETFQHELNNSNLEKEEKELLYNMYYLNLVFNDIVRGEFNLNIALLNLTIIKDIFKEAEFLQNEYNELINIDLDSIEDYELNEIETLTTFRENIEYTYLLLSVEPEDETVEDFFNNYAQAVLMVKNFIKNNQ
jgi:hypothetical protein